MRKPKTVKQVLIRAAELIESKQEMMCCYAIDAAVKPLYGRNHEGFKEYPEIGRLAYLHLCSLFEPYETNERWCFPGNTDGMAFWSNESGKDYPKHQKLRVLCLLFAAASFEGVKE